MQRHYRLRQDKAVIDADMVRSPTPDDHRRGFATAITALVADFNAYLDRGGTDPAADLVGYRQHAVRLSPDELVEMIGEPHQAIAPRPAHQPAPGRARYRLSPILFPAAESG
ncbi:MAG TPA: hypothetical protein VHF06_29500 [Pseudonocardiaceae bacterium]|nr:hypothetical protein [Pseudonocardiaceae bacterium]